MTMVTAMQRRARISHRVTTAAAQCGVLFLCLILLLTAAAAWANPPDALAQLPAAWSQKLLPIPERDLSGASSLARKRILDTRQQLGARLKDTSAPASELAAAYGKLAALYQVYAMPALAEIGYKNATTLAPTSFRWRYLSAWLADETGKAAAALKQYQQARQLKPDYPTLALRIGKILFDLDQLDAAKTELEKALEIPGNRATAHFYLGQIALLKRQFAEAANHFRQTLQLAPDASAAHFPLAQSLRGMGETEAARKQAKLTGKKLPRPEDALVDELIRLKIGARPYFKQALDAVRNRDYDTAREKFEQGLERDPDNPNALVSYARVLYLAGDPERAEATLKKVLTKNPNHANANFFLALILDQKAGDQAAEPLFKKTLDKNPYHAGAHFFLANLLLRTGRYQQALNHYDEALSIDDKLLPAKFYRLMAQRLLGKPAPVIIAELGRLKMGFAALYPSYGGEAPSIITYAIQQLRRYPNPNSLLQDPVLIPAPADPYRPIRDYPSARPY